MCSSKDYTRGMPSTSTFPAILWLLPCGGIIFLVFCLAITWPLISKRHRSGDEETLPLLIDSNEQGSGSQQRGYDSIQNNPPPATVEQNIHHYGLETRVYPTGILKCLLPYFWPRKKRLLQLVYVGIGICLFAERILRVLIPLQLAQVTNILTQEPATLPWKGIGLFIGFRALVSKGGIPAVRVYLWFPLDKYICSRITTAAFDKIDSLSSEFHDSRDSANLLESTIRGLSIKFALRSVVFQLIPTIVDAAIAASVLSYIFGDYMTLIIFMAGIGILCSKVLIMPKILGKSMLMDKGHRVFSEPVSNRRTVTCLDRIDLERGQYSSAVTNQTDSPLKLFQWFHLETVVQSLLTTLGLMAACLLVTYQIVVENMPVGNFVLLLCFCAQLSSPLQSFTSVMNGVKDRVMNATELALLLKRQPKIRGQHGPTSESTEFPTTSNVCKQPETYPEDAVFPDEEDLKNDPTSITIRKGNSGNTCSTPSRVSILKPDAPEFIPSSQRPVPKRSQTVIEQKSAYRQPEEASKYCPKGHSVDKENIPRMSNGLLETGNAPKVPTGGENKAARVSQVHHDSTETNTSREFGSVLEPNTTGTVLMSPKKPRKKGKGLKKKQVLRRQLTKSEPAGMGLIPF